MDLASKTTAKRRLRRSNQTMPLELEETKPTTKCPLRRTKTMPVKLVDYTKQRAVCVRSGDHLSTSSLHSTTTSGSRKTPTPQHRSRKGQRLSVSAAADAASEILKEDILKDSSKKPYLPLIAIASPKSPSKKPAACVPLTDDSCSTHDTNRMCYLPKGSLHSSSSSRPAPYGNNRSGPKGMSIQLTDRLLHLDDSTSSLLDDSEDLEITLKSHMDASSESCFSSSDSSSSDLDSSASDSESDDSDSESESNPLLGTDDSSSDESSSSSSESEGEDSDDDESLVLSELSEEDHTSMTTSLSFCDDAGSNYGSVCFSLRKKKKANAAPTAPADRGQTTIPIPSAIRLQRSLSKMLAATAKTGDDGLTASLRDDSTSNRRRTLRKSHSFGTGYLIPSEAAALGPHSTCDEILRSMPQLSTKKSVGPKRDPLRPLLNAMTAHPASTRLDKKSSSSSKLLSTMSAHTAGQFPPRPPSKTLARTRSAGASLGAQLDVCSARMLIDKCSGNGGGRSAAPFMRSNTNESVDSRTGGSRTAPFLKRSITTESAHSRGSTDSGTFAKYSDFEKSCSTLESSISSFWNSTDCDAATFASGDNESVQKSDDETNNKKPPSTRTCSLGTLAALMEQENSSSSSTRQSLTMGSNSNHTSRSLNAGLTARDDAARKENRRRHSRRTKSNSSSRSLNSGLNDLDSSTRSLGTLGRMVQTQSSSRSLGGVGGVGTSSNERRANRRGRMTKTTSSKSLNGGLGGYGDSDLNSSTRSLNTGTLGRLLMADSSSRSLNGGGGDRDNRRRRRRLKRTNAFAAEGGNSSSRSLGTTGLPMTDTSENNGNDRSSSPRRQRPPLGRRKSFTSLRQSGGGASSSADASASLFVTGSRIRRIEISATCA